MVADVKVVEGLSAICDIVCPDDSPFQFYSFGKRPGNFISCTWETQIGRNERCTVAPIKWVAYDTDIECSKPEKFGMYHGQPCLMLKLNKVFGWEPQPYYNMTEVRPRVC